MPKIHRATYRHGLVDDDDLEELTGLERVELEGVAISRDIVVAIYDNQLLGAAGEYGDPLVGDPLQYDELTIEHAGGTTRIGLFNRGIMLLTTHEEFYKRVQRLRGHPDSRESDLADLREKKAAGATVLQQQSGNRRIPGRFNSLPSPPRKLRQIGNL